MAFKQEICGLLAGGLLANAGWAGAVESSSNLFQTRIQGEQAQQRLGSTVTLAELTGDGAADLVVGSPSFTPPQSQDSVWAVHIYPGGNGEPVLIHGEQAAGENASLKGQSGLSVAAIPQANQECNTLAVGVSDQRNPDGKAVGAVHLYDLCQGVTQAPDPHVTIWGEQANGRFGFSLAGNENDLLVGAINQNTGQTQPGQEGMVFRIPRQGLLGAVAAQEAASRVYIGDDDYGFFGYSVGFGPDFNADGHPDVLIGAPAHGRGGEVLLYGGDRVGDGPAVAPDQAYLVLVPNQEDAGFGVRVAAFESGSNTLGAGVLAGASIYDGVAGNQTRQGGVFYFPLRHAATTVADTIDTFSGQGMTPQNAIAFLPEQAGAEMGTVAVVPDLDDGGSREILVGAPLYSVSDNEGAEEGAAFLYRGEDLAPGQSPRTPALANAAYFGEQQGAQLGSSLSAAAPGGEPSEPDLVVGARGHDNADVANAGAAFVYNSERVADLELVLTEQPQTGREGESLQYIFRVTNKQSNATAPSARVVAPSPENVAFPTGESTGDCSYGPGGIRCAVGELEAGESATVTMRFTPKDAGELQLIGTLHSDAVVDPDPANNVAEAEPVAIAAGDTDSDGSDGTSASGGSSDSSSGCSLGGGGCTLNRGGFFDPVFPLLLAMAGWWLMASRGRAANENEIRT